MSPSEQHKAVMDFQSREPQGVAPTEADEKLEAEITHARLQADRAMDRVAEHREKMKHHANTARSFYLEMSQLVAQRSPEQVARIEREKGLTK